jgi:transposase
LLDLKLQEDDNLIKLWYFDESGFSLNSNVPYAWQEKENRLHILSGRSKRLNVLGLLRRNNEFISGVFEGNTTIDTVLSFMESFVIDMTGKNVIIMDNATVHNIPEYKLFEWSEKGLKIVKLTPYSPELNIIEILWRFIKYKWLELSAYGSYKSLVESVCNILALVGIKYEINFV